MDTEDQIEKKNKQLKIKGIKEDSSESIKSKGHA